MFKTSNIFSSFSVDDSEKAKTFYSEILGMEIDYVKGMEEFGIMELHTPGNNNIIIYPKSKAHSPANFTILNFPVDNIDAAVDDLTKKGVTFESYNDEWIKTDEKGIARSDSSKKEPSVAWFKDPAGNILAVMEEN